MNHLPHDLLSGDEIPGELPEPLDRALRAPLIDQHGQGARDHDLDRAEFEQALGARPAPPGTTHFDSPIGAAIRRWCAPVLDLESHAAPAAYLARRGELGADEANRRLLRAAGVSVFCTDTGQANSGRLTPVETARLAGGAGHEIVRLERLAADVARREPNAAGYADELSGELELRSRRAVAVKSVIACHLGLAVDPMPPEPGEVTAAASRWMREGGEDRLVDPILLRHGLWAGLEIARERKLPLQFHVGLGAVDAEAPGIDLYRADPASLAPFLREAQGYGVPIVLVNTFPFVRQAACLAAAYPHVYLDVGSGLALSGPASAGAIAEALAIAPFHKLMFGSGSFGLAEHTLLGSVYHRRGLARLLARRVAEGEWTTADAARIARLIGSDTARRVYRLAG